MSDKDIDVGTLFKNKRTPIPGDVVVLKSGGSPKMVIGRMNGGYAMCRFFTANGALSYHEIEPAALRIVEYA